MASVLTLARCIGFGGSSGGSPSTNSFSSAVAVTSVDANVVAYTAGSTVVLMDVKSKQQLGFYRDESPGLPLGCLAFGGGTDVSSNMPMHLAAGEQGGAASQVLVWSVSSGQVIARLKQHKHGVSSVCFSPDGKQLLSAGSSYDGQVCLWDYQKGVLLARASAQAEIMAATFAADGSIASAGKEHLKVWGMTGGGVGKKLGAPGSITLTPRAFSLKDLRSQMFVDVKSGGENSMYALTASGVLMYIHEAGSRTVDKTVNVQVAAAHSLAVSPHLVACTCSAGTVRLFATHTLAFRANMPRPSPTHAAAQHTTGSVATGLQRAGSFSGANGGIGGDCFPDAVRASFDASGAQLSVAYADRSLLIWDVRDLKKITRVRCLLSHSAAIWGAEMLPHRAAVNMGLVSDTPSLDPSHPGLDQTAHESAIVTCSADGTIRLWSLTHDDGKASASAAASRCPAKSSHARTLRGVVYPATEQEGGEGVLAEGMPAAHGMYSPELSMPVSGPGSKAANRHTAPTSLRCLKVSPDGSHLAIGDAQGNVRIYSLATLTLLAFKVAHDGEVLSLDYGAGFLASGGRDSVIHIYAVANKYALVNTLEDHSASVTAVRFSPCGQRLISAGADKAIVFRKITDAKDCSVHTYCTHVVAPHTGSGAASAMGAALNALGGRRGGTKKGLVYDLALDSTGTWAVAAVQGGTLLVFDVSTGKQVKQLKTGTEMVRVALDGSGSAAYCGCADGSLAVYALSLMGPGQDDSWGGMWGPRKREKGQWGEGVGTASKAGGGGGSDSLVAQVAGHAEVLTAVVVLGGSRKGVVTVGGDGCILHWHLPASGADAVSGGTVVDAQGARAGLLTDGVRQLATAGKEQASQQPRAAPRAATPTRTQPSMAAATQWGGAAAEGAGGGMGADRAPGVSPLRGGANRAPNASPLRGGGGSGRLAAGKSPMRGGGRLAAGVSSPMRDGRRAAAVLGGGGRGARCGSTANAMVDVEVMGEPLQSIDKLPSWAAGSLSPARGGRMAQAVNAAEEALVPSLSRFADPPPPAPHQPAAAPSPQPTSKQQRQQWQVEGPQEGAAPSTGNSPYGVRKWAEDLEEADDIVLLSAGSAEDSTSFKVCEQEGAGAEMEEDDCRGVVDQATLSGAASTAARNGAKGTPPPAGGPVARDLFRAHFGDLDQSSTSASPAFKGLEPHVPPKDERRQSLTTLYRTMASRVLATGPHKDSEAVAPTSPEQLLGLQRLQQQQLPQSSTKTATHPKQPVTPEKELKVGRDVAEGAMGATSAFRLQRTPQQTAAKGRAGQSHTGAAAMEVDDQAGQLVSPAGHTQDALGAKRSASRGRSGKMAGELSKMRDRLLSLQQTYSEQQARQTPWRQQQREQRQEQRQASSPSPCARRAHLQQQGNLKQQCEEQQGRGADTSAPLNTPMSHQTHRAPPPAAPGNGAASSNANGTKQAALQRPSLQRLSSANKARQQQQQQRTQPLPSQFPLAARTSSTASALQPAAASVAPSAPAAPAAAAGAPSEPSAPTASGVTEVSFGAGLSPANGIRPGPQQQQQQDQLSKASPDCVTSGPAPPSATPHPGAAAPLCGGVASTPTKPATPPKVPLSASSTPTKDSGTPTPLPSNSAAASKPPMSSSPSSQKSSLLSKLKRAFSLKSPSPHKEALPTDQQQQQQQQQHSSFSSLWSRNSSGKKKRGSGSGANSSSKDAAAPPQASPSNLEGGNESGSAAKPSRQNGATSSFKTAAAALAEAASQPERTTLPSPQASFNFATGLASATKLGVDGLSAEAAPAAAVAEEANRAGSMACGHAGQASSDRFDSLAAWAAPSLSRPQSAADDTPRSLPGVPQDTAWLPLSPDPEVRQSCDKEAASRQATAGGDLSLRQSAAKGDPNARALTDVRGSQQGAEGTLTAPQSQDLQQDPARVLHQDWKARAAARGYKLEDSWARHSGDGSGWSADASQSGSKGVVVGRADAGRQSVNFPAFQSAPKQPQGHRYGDGEGIAPDAAHSEEGRGSTGTACQLVEAEDEVCSRMRMHPVAMAGTALQQQQQEVGMDGPDGACSKMSDMALGSGQGEGPTKAGRAGGQLVALPTQPHTAAQGNTKQQQQQQQQLEGRPVKEHVAAFEEAMQAARQQRLASTPLKQQQQQQQQLGNMSPWRGAPPQQQHKQQAQLLPPDSLEGALASLELAAQHVECQIAAAGDASRGGLQQHHKAVLVRVVGQLGGLLQDKHSSSSSSGGADHGELDVVPASGRMQDQKEGRQMRPDAVPCAVPEPGCIKGDGLGEQLAEMDRNFDFKFERIQQERHMERVMQGIN